MNSSTGIISRLQKPIIIVGYGISGRAAKKLLCTELPENDVLTYDDKDGVSTLTRDELVHKYAGGTLIVSPGVPLQEKWIQEYLQNGGNLSSEMEIAFSFLTTEKVICVTGSIGKSTTAGLLGAGALTFDENSFLGGNFGVPLADYIHDLRADLRKRAQWLILELSSYQLENFKNLKSDYSVLTFLTANHLERYPSLEKYYQTQWLLVEKSDVIVANSNGGDLKNYIGNRESKKIKWTDRHDPVVEKYSLKDCKLVGTHNLDNLALAATVAQIAKWPISSIEAMKKYPGLPHRMENLGEKGGVQFINDSKATTIDSVLQAVASICEQMKPPACLHVLIGGKDKNLPWEDLAKLKKFPFMHFIFFGQVGQVAKKRSGLEGHCFVTLREAIASMRTILKKGDIVLLSPGGTSLDEFKNFEARGDFFKSEISKHW
jgi:UDP-N-acetylmuramoylalanine--D-glutamate ligase